MPKITEQKKPVKKVQPKQEEPLQKHPEVKAEPKVTVFRVFECLIHLEIALKQLNQVGIFPGNNSESLKTRHTITQSTLESLYKDYKEIWGAMPKS